MNNLADKLTEEKIFVKEIKPDEIKKSVTAVSLKIEQTEENKEYIRSVLSEFPRSVLKTELVGQLEIADVEAGNVTIKLVGRVSIDENAYNEFTRKLILGLDKIAMKKESAVIEYDDKEILPMSPGGAKDRDLVSLLSQNQGSFGRFIQIEKSFFVIGALGSCLSPERKFFIFSLPEEITSNRKKRKHGFSLNELHTYINTVSYFLIV